MIRQRLKRGLVQMVAASVALLGQLGSAVADESTASKSAAPAVSQLANGGFALDFEIWQPAGHGKAKGLSITYTWGGVTRTVDASRQNDRWHAEFPTQPAAHEQANLLLRYSFELSADDLLKIHGAEAKLVDAIMQAIDTASDLDIAARKAAADTNAKAADAKAQAEKDVLAAATALAKATTDLATAKQGTNQEEVAKAAQDEEKARLADQTARAQLAAASKALESPAVPQVKFEANFAEAGKGIAANDDARLLRQYGSKDQDGVALLLEHLGIAEGENGWEVVAEKKKTLAEIASSWVETDGEVYTSDITQKVKDLAATQAEDGCVLPAKSQPDDLSVEEAQALLKSCVAVLSNQPAGKEAKVADALKGLLNTSGEDRAIYAEAVLKSALGRGYAALAVRLAERTLIRAEKRTVERAKLLALLVDGLDTAFEAGGRKEDGATLVKGAAKPRRYDIATGAVYVPHLEDVVVPSMIAVCAWEGCLDTSEVPWTAKHGWGRAFSLDAGIRLKTLGKQDRRQSDTVSFLMGLSFNPFSVLRISGGMYGFENAQKKNDGTYPWQFVPYVGATLNVLNAATILGSIGLNNDMSPTATPVE